MDKWRSNAERLKNEANESNDELLERHRMALERVQERKKQGLKCDADVHSFREIKYKTWGELQKRRWKELNESRDANTQALTFEIAERVAKAAAQDADKYEVDRRRQAISKETLALQDRARAAFIKIQQEPDERRVVQMMADLGFDMPKLPGKEAEEAE